MLRFSEVVNRALNGPICSEKEFDMEIFVPELQRVVKKYEIKYDPQNALAFYRLGTIYMQMGQKSEAIDNYENFIKFWKGDPVQIQNVQKLLDELKQQSP